MLVKILRRKFTYIFVLSAKQHWVNNLYQNAVLFITNAYINCASLRKWLDTMIDRIFKNGLQRQEGNFNRMPLVTNIPIYAKPFA